MMDDTRVDDDSLMSKRRHKHTHKQALGGGLYSAQEIEMKKSYWFSG